MAMQFLHRFQCNGQINTRISRLYSSTCSLNMKKCTRSRDACNRNITNHIFKQQTVFSVRFVETFGSGDKKLGGIRGKIAYLLTLETFQYAIWFVGCMCLVFLTAAISQKHKYKDSSYFTGHASLMDVDQLEVGFSFKTYFLLKQFFQCEQHKLKAFYSKASCESYVFKNIGYKRLKYLLCY